MSGIKMMNFAVVTSTRDSLKTVRECIRCIKDYTQGNYIHIVTDDSSGDSTLEYLRELNNNNLIKLLEYRGDEKPHLQEVLRRGFNCAFNLGVEYIFTVESDVYVTTNWSTKLIEDIKSLSDAAGVTAITVNESGQLEHPMKNDLPDLYRRDWVVGRFNEIVPMQKHLTFCCTLFRVEACRKIDFCKEDSVTGVDIRYSEELRSLGYNLYVDLGVFVYHPKPHSSRREWKVTTNQKPMK